ncbi:unnamed protein product [Tilletia laevis]|uniref:DNA/RNA-binding protein Kin17 WH-like domain-containing protein n=3 Tax=Tilletia TaxID=13289 RepID=A0A8X7MP97_9BASI|nr:hypothetical protein CF336_g5546 [Tilletia laevis]KAE8191282.1 hypothetical protein CF328_g5724 [Tilletia controversa]KAE8256398.1 hypothetical protein A4X03_0g5403 [Tilletia caries]KAE8195006.1 hypothetical protein CF335_g5198 [Tilletia laevis]KAE8243825.1 hypothetical protein A4X06_0g6091 [Tilletia controversa]
MPKAAAGTAKAASNAMKAKGLTKLRFYCQICEKANRDENGYKCHIESESHLRKAAALGPGASSTKPGAGGLIDDFSREFQDAFVQLLSRRFGTRRIKANRVYQEYIADRHHLHMNATRWLSLSEFVKHLGREGIATVEDSEEGWFLTWIDNSPGALARQDALGRMNRQKMNDEQRERKLLQQQIERATAAEQQQQNDTSPAEGTSASASASTSSPEEGNKPEVGLLLRKPDAAPLKLGFSLSTSLSTSASAPAPAPASMSTSTSSTTDAPAQIPVKPLTFAMSKPPALTNVFRATTMSTSKSTPRLPPTNAFKKAAAAAAASTSTAPSSSSSSRPVQLTAAERLREEEAERKRRMVGPQPSAKRMRL